MKTEPRFSMPYFDTYSSNTVAGSGNQLLFRPEDPLRPLTGRVYYRVEAGGRFGWSFLFSNTIDTTFSDGKVGHCNLVCDEWKILSAAVGVSKTADPSTEPVNLIPLTFDGKPEKTVAPGGFFTSDRVELEADAGTYLCLQISFCGRMIPCHEESLLPVFRLAEDGQWAPCRQMPLASMVGCDRPVKLRVGYLGDSITQGIGTEQNSYTHWNAVLSGMLGTDFAFWNLGLGYARASDAASDSAWLFRAKQNDWVVLCLGVNDLWQTRDGEALKRNLTETVRKLKSAGVRVVLQSVPPFDYDPELTKTWREVNRYLRETLATEADAYFDTVPVLRKSVEEDFTAAYGGHPNAEGCQKWAEALFPLMQTILHGDSDETVM